MNHHGMTVAVTSSGEDSHTNKERDLRIHFPLVRFQLIVGRERITERPLLGKLKRDNYAAISFSFAADGVDAGAGTTTPLALKSLAEPPQTCEALARVLISERGTSERVVIEL